MSKKTIPIPMFVDELIERIDGERTIDCCKEEIKNLALLAKARLSEEMIEVEWKD